MMIEMGAATHVGRVRRVNEDSYLAHQPLAVVADGMGGHARGDLASARAIEGFATLATAEHLKLEDIQHAIANANDSILAEAAASPEKHGMGSTLSGVAMVEYGGSPHWIVFNVGDSRVYRIAAGEAIQLTVDHSEVAELVARHEISPEEARTHPLRHVVTRSLGVDPFPPPDLWIFPPSPAGDVFLACSDGLTNELSDDQIAAIVTAARSPRDAAAQLVGAAVEAGGRDNVTAVLAVLPPDDVEDELSVSTTPREDWS